VGCKYPNLLQCFLMSKLMFKNSKTISKRYFSKQNYYFFYEKWKMVLTSKEKTLVFGEKIEGIRKPFHFVRNLQGIYMSKILLEHKIFLHFLFPRESFLLLCKHFSTCLFWKCLNIFFNDHFHDVNQKQPWEVNYLIITFP